MLTKALSCRSYWKFESTLRAATMWLVPTSRTITVDCSVALILFSLVMFGWEPRQLPAQVVEGERAFAALLAGIQIQAEPFGAVHAPRPKNVGPAQHDGCYDSNYDHHGAVSFIRDGYTRARS